MTEAEWDRSEDSLAMVRWLQQSEPPSQRTSRPRGCGGISDRKLRLFAVAMCRHWWSNMTHPNSQRAIEEAERFADGQSSTGKMANIMDAAGQSKAYAGYGRMAHWVAPESSPQTPATCVEYLLRHCIPIEDRSAIAALLRDIVGNPWHPLTCGWEQTGQEQVWRADWRLTADVARLAQAAYDERHPESGHLDPVRLLVLADALEEAGCVDDNILFHLRGEFGCDACDGAGHYYDPPYSLNRLACKKCEGTGSLPHPPHVRGCHVLDALLGKGRGQLTANWR